MNLSLGSVRQWHWISAAVCIVGMLFFAWTGITLNHANDIPSEPQINTIEAEIPMDMLVSLRSEDANTQSLPDNIHQYLLQEFDLYIPRKLQGELADGEFYFSMPQPGVDAWLAIDVPSGEFIYERTDRGWISFFNDLHKGRYTDAAWGWFIDIFAVVTIIFCLSGLWLLFKQAKVRISTWPLVALGLVVPAVVILANLH